MRIDESVRQHGRRQIEMKLGLVLDPEERSCRYAVETYFFLPAVLMIDPQTYGSREFLRGLKNYVRMRPAKRPLSAYAPGGEASELMIRALARASDRRERALKRYGLGLRAAVKMQAKHCAQPGGMSGTLGFMEALDTAFAHWRKTFFEPIREDVAARAVDEFLSVSSVVFVRRLLQALEEQKASPKMQRVCADFLRRETAYRLARYPKTAVTTDPEQALYRWRMLRKYVSNVLYLRPEVGEGNPWLKQSLYGAAAAFSMIFATIVAFMWQSKYGALSMNLFIALVIAYIFKDRLKDGLREALARIFRRWLPNRRTKLTRSDGRRVGYADEMVDYLAPKEIPADVAALRESARTLPFADEHGENVLRYRKTVEIDAEVVGGELGMRALYDITRISTEPWTESIDRRFEELPYVDEEDEEPVPIEKRYHVYMVRVLETAEGRTADIERIVLSEAGVMALEGT